MASCALAFDASADSDLSYPHDSFHRRCSRRLRNGKITSNKSREQIKHHARSRFLTYDMLPKKKNKKAPNENWLIFINCYIASAPMMVSPFSKRNISKFTLGICYWNSPLQRIINFPTIKINFYNDFINCIWYPMSVRLCTIFFCS